MPARPRAAPKPYAWLKPGVLIGSLAPLLLLVIDAVRGRLGADPVAIALNRLGLLALILLLACLCATPLRLVFQINWGLRIRKLLGLLAFFYASLHVLTYLVVDQRLALAAIWQDVTKRGFIMIGALTWLLLVPLAITSTAGMRKRLGGARWQRLHRLIYPAAICAIIHFVWRVKQDVTEPMLYGAVLAALLLVRVRSSVQRANRAAGSVAD